MKSATDGMNLLGFSTNTNKSSANWDASKVPANFIHSSRQADGPKRLHLSDSNRKSEISKFYLQVITHLHTDVTCIIHDTIFIDVPTLSKRWGGGQEKQREMRKSKKMENWIWRKRIVTCEIFIYTQTVKNYFFFFLWTNEEVNKKKTISKNKNKNRSRDESKSFCCASTSSSLFLLVLYFGFERRKPFFMIWNLFLFIHFLLLHFTFIHTYNNNNISL